MTAELVSNCPKCNGKVKRLIGVGAGPIFKEADFIKPITKTHQPVLPIIKAIKLRKLRIHLKRVKVKQKNPRSETPIL